MTDLPDPVDYRAWIKLFPAPATPAQLKNLAALHGLVLSYQEPFSDGAEDDPRRYVLMRTHDNSRTLVQYYDDSPIERYIARIAECHRGQR